MKVRWTEPAWQDLSRIEDYLSRGNPIAAVEMVRTIHQAAQSLREYPLRGRPAANRRPWRELILLPSPFLIAYEVNGQEVAILRVWHAAQNRGRGSRKKR